MQGNNTKYIIYARKSTDVDDKQIRSIGDQLAELREYAISHKLVVVDELTEKQSAKAPGRPVFKTLLERIERGKAEGILAWNPDRLARNSIDGGQIIYMLDTGKIKDLAFPTQAFTNDPNGKFALSMAFGQSKYYTDALSVNVKRGFRQKCLRGEYPIRAPFGYLNNSRTKTVVADKHVAPHLFSAFELYAKGDSTFQDVAQFLFDKGVKTTLSRKKLSSNQARNILRNPFYSGVFRYSGEVYEGNYKPLVSDELFARVKEVMGGRGKKK